MKANKIESSESTLQGTKKLTLREKRLAAKVCVCCGLQDERTISGKENCQLCADKKAEQAKRIRWNRGKNRQCVSCGKQDERTINGYTNCEVCASKKRGQRLKKRMRAANQKGD